MAAAELSVQLMKVSLQCPQSLYDNWRYFTQRSGIVVPEDCINVVLEYYAMRGDVSAAEQFMAKSIIGS